MLHITDQDRIGGELQRTIDDMQMSINSKNLARALQTFYSSDVLRANFLQKAAQQLAYRDTVTPATYLSVKYTPHNACALDVDSFRNRDQK